MSARRIVLVAAVAVLALALGVIAGLARREASATVLQSATLLEPPRAVPDFLLTDQFGAPFTKVRLQGGWTILFAGFASCPDVCPATLAMLREIETRLAARGKTLRIVFLSVDPERDTAARLKSWAAHYSESFLAVTAPEPELGRVAQSMGIAYVKVPAADQPGAYTVDHSAALLLFNPQGDIAAYFLAPHDPAVLADDLERAMELGA
jgi:protein SCO1/2